MEKRGENFWGRKYMWVKSMGERERVREEWGDS